MSKYRIEIKILRYSLIIVMTILAISCRYSGHKKSINTTLDSINLKTDSNSSKNDSVRHDITLGNQETSSIVDTNANGFIDCDKLFEFEKKAHSLESLKDKYLKDLLSNYYTLDENQVNKEIEKNVKEYYPSIDSNSVLKIKINDGFANGYEVDMTGKDFDFKNHKITDSERFTCRLIDDHIFWGTDEGWPKEEIDRFEITYKGTCISIPKKVYSNLNNPLRYGGKKCHGVFLVDNKKHYVIFILFGSDGAGSYNASFIFKDRKYLRLVVERMC